MTKARGASLDVQVVSKKHGTLAEGTRDESLCIFLMRPLHDFRD